MSMSFETLESEVLKLQVLCICCHAYKTATEDLNKTGVSDKPEAIVKRARIEKFREPIRQDKMARGCEWPGCAFKAVIAEQLHHDHKDPDTKIADISRMYYAKGYTPEFGQREVAKCGVFCANHHNVRTILQHYNYCVWKTGFPTTNIGEFIDSLRARAVGADSSKDSESESDDDEAREQPNHVSGSSSSNMG